MVSDSGPRLATAFGRAPGKAGRRESGPRIREIRVISG
jgi:hypothetical protein